MGRLALVLLLICVIFSLSFVESEETPTFLGVENLPPYVIQNFSDINLIAGVPSIDYLDLDDYFAEDNGEELNITWETTLTNITITVNSEHEVSFYPEAGYIGSGQLRFTVADAVGNATGNWFTVTVGDDNQAPKWSNPQKSKSTIYQNNVVNFTTTWTDNLGLDNFIFSINQGSNWVNSSSVSFTGLVNQSFFSTIISAPPGSTVSWRFYAQDLYGNLNATPIKEFTVTPFDYSRPEDEDDEGDDDSLADDLASIISSPDAIVSEAETSNFKVDVNNIKISLRQGDTISKTIRVTNTGQDTLDFTTDLSSLEHFGIISDSGFILEPGETKDLTLEFKIPERIMPDQYFGFLRIEADEAIDIPIILDIKKFESEISVNVFIPERYKTTRAGKESRAVVTIISTKDLREANLSVFYAIKNFKGDILESDTLDIELFSSFEDAFVLTVPQETPDGEYVFYVRATGKDLIDIGSDTFFVGARFRVLRIIQRLFYPLLFLIIASIIIILVMVYKRNKEKQKALELYIMLNEMRSLVKQGKMEEAVEIYKRIKVSYNQRVSSDFQKDKEKLKEELNKFAGLLKQNPVEQKPQAKPATAAKPTTPQTKPATAAKQTTPTKATPATGPKPAPQPKPTTPQQPQAKPQANNITQAKTAQAPTSEKPTSNSTQPQQQPKQNNNKVAPVMKNLVKKTLPLKATENKEAQAPQPTTQTKPQSPAQQKPTAPQSTAPQSTQANTTSSPKPVSPPKQPSQQTTQSKPATAEPATPQQPQTKPQQSTQQTPPPTQQQNQQPTTTKKDGGQNETQSK